MHLGHLLNFVDFFIWWAHTRKNYVKKKARGIQITSFLVSFRYTHQCIAGASQFTALLRNKNLGRRILNLRFGREQWRVLQTHQ